jgi:MT-A70
VKQTALPQKRYGVILSVPEWRFEPWSRETGMERAADNHYRPRGRPDPGARRRVDRSRRLRPILVGDGAHTAAGARGHARLGLTYKSCFVWAKDSVGTGYWNRNKHELLLVGTGGDVPAPAPGTQWESLISAPVGAHSEKPAKVYELIEAYFPNLAKIEVNARAPGRDGNRWGSKRRRPAAFISGNAPSH